MTSRLLWDAAYLVIFPIIIFAPIFALLKLADFIERYVRCGFRSE